MTSQPAGTAVLAFTPEAGQASDNQARVLCQQVLWVEAEPLEHTGSEGVNQDVGAPVIAV